MKKKSAALKRRTGKHLSVDSDSRMSDPDRCWVHVAAMIVG
jgi:hypothetical protein